MNAQRVQGIAFSLIALVVAAFPLPVKADLPVLAALILVLGVPHGALDTIFARKLHGVRTIYGWVAFAFAYFIPVLLVVGLWQLAPMWFLIGFLLISTAHFSGDPESGTPITGRIVYGGAIIVLPALLHASEVERLFSFLVGSAAAAQIVPWLHLLARSWLIGLAAAAIWSLRTNWLTGLEMTAVAILSVFAAPLLAFTVFFCGMHSARHILRTFRYSDQENRWSVIAAMLAPLFGVLIISAAAFSWLRNTPIETRFIQILFVGLAALTVPHMALVERVRFSGWRDFNPLTKQSSRYSPLPPSAHGPNTLPPAETSNR